MVLDSYFSRLFFLFISLSASSLQASSISSGIDSSNLELQKINENVYAIIGPLTQRSDKNIGNNATFGFVITEKGIVLIDSGGGLKAAKKIHSLIKTVSKKPIKYVINTGGQDHRWFGNAYFKKLGATIIASKTAVVDQKARVGFQYTMLSNLIGDENIKGTKNYYADIVFDSLYQFTLGKTKFEIRHAGQAHTPGDSFVWLPQQKIIFSGDIIYLERMLAVGSMSNALSWMKVFKEIDKLKPKVIVPGHGHVGTLAAAKRDTYDYLVYLYAGMKKYHNQGISETKISEFNQSKYKYLKAYKQLKGRNALKVFMEIEFDSMK